MPDLNPPQTEAPAAPPDSGHATAAREKRPSRLSRMLDHARRAGRDLVAAALGKLLEPPDSPAPSPDGQSPAAALPNEAPPKRPGVLHVMTAQLRATADSYVAAKMDEIEARVDTKLDDIEARIDRKVVELHRQLVEMRDREIRHRLRLLKITLIFTVLVAVVSLGYRWVSKLWLS